MAVTETGHEAEHALDELYRRHGAQVYRYAFAVLGNHADAEDVVQTTFLNAYRSLEQGVRPQKPANWLLTIASNTIKQSFRQKRARPHEVLLDHDPADTSNDEEGPTIGELLTALWRIPRKQRQAIVLREFEGRSYAEIARILDVTTSALETLLFRARRSLADELEGHLTCTEAQFAVSRAADRRLGRRERSRLRQHLLECPDCAHFARLQRRHRRALRGLTLVPVPVSLSVLHETQGSAAAAVLPVGASTAAVGSGSAALTSGALTGGLVLKAAAVAAAATVVGGVTALGGSDIQGRAGHGTPAPHRSTPHVELPGPSTSHHDAGRHHTPATRSARTHTSPTKATSTGGRRQKLSAGSASTRGASRAGGKERARSSSATRRRGGATSSKAHETKPSRAVPASQTAASRRMHSIKTRGRSVEPPFPKPADGVSHMPAGARAAIRP